ncbi:hypothetical protein FIBSPDRAFT_938372 [Athelia psychrophila]|uniref:Uncharacterized protein n=1 Tax=Athelia psychrophila TaxID=1759441 RepID=A0A165YNV0_9AGAM|nr:hypothetical protein FIBSPDRAFT_938372 [Fibularhizoctonia sp. CBS 109695]
MAWEDKVRLVAMEMWGGRVRLTGDWPGIVNLFGLLERESVKSIGRWTCYRLNTNDGQIHGKARSVHTGGYTKGPAPKFSEIKCCSNGLIYTNSPWILADLHTRKPANVGPRYFVHMRTLAVHEKLDLEWQCRIYGCGALKVSFMEIPPHHSFCPDLAAATEADQCGSCLNAACIQSFGILEGL